MKKDDNKYQYWISNTYYVVMLFFDSASNNTSQGNTGRTSKAQGGGGGQRAGGMMFQDMGRTFPMMYHCTCTGVVSLLCCLLIHFLYVHQFM